MLLQAHKQEVQRLRACMEENGVWMNQRNVAVHELEGQVKKLQQQLTEEAASKGSIFDSLTAAKEALLQPQNHIKSTHWTQATAVVFR